MKMRLSQIHCRGSNKWSLLLVCTSSSYIFHVLLILITEVPQDEQETLTVDEESDLEAKNVPVVDCNQTTGNEASTAPRKEGMTYIFC